LFAAIECGNRKQTGADRVRARHNPFKTLVEQAVVE